MTTAERIFNVNKSIERTNSLITYFRKENLPQFIKDAEETLDRQLDLLKELKREYRAELIESIESNKAILDMYTLDGINEHSEEYIDRLNVQISLIKDLKDL